VKFSWLALGHADSLRRDCELRYLRNLTADYAAFADEENRLPACHGRQASCLSLVARTGWQARTPVCHDSQGWLSSIRL